MSKKPSTSLYCLIARDAPVAVVFRKGPSKLVQLLRWNLLTDAFEKGQWFKGRIYERYCDLSPSGKYLVYWAGNQRPPYWHWTAVSRPPYLTALMLSPNVGSAGGGLFADELNLELSNLGQIKKQGNTFPARLQLSRWEGAYDSLHGFLCEARLLRDGWQSIQRGEKTKTRDSLAEARVRYLLEPMDIMQKVSGTTRLEMRTIALHEVGGPTHVVEYRVIDENGGISVDLQRADWADWEANGDLLFAKEGCIFRLAKGQIGVREAKTLIDLSDAHFEEMETPEQFKHW